MQQSKQCLKLFNFNLSQQYLCRFDGFHLPLYVLHLHAVRAELGVRKHPCRGADCRLRRHLGHYRLHPADVFSLINDLKAKPARIYHGGTVEALENLLVCKGKEIELGLLMSQNKRQHAGLRILKDC